MSAQGKVALSDYCIMGYKQAQKVEIANIPVTNGTLLVQFDSIPNYDQPRFGAIMVQMISCPSSASPSPPCGGQSGSPVVPKNPSPAPSSPPPSPPPSGPSECNQAPCLVSIPQPCASHLKEAVQIDPAALFRFIWQQHGLLLFTGHA